jgi:hypothetical protein
VFTRSPNVTRPYGQGIIFIEERWRTAMAVQSDFRIIAVNEYIGTDPSALNTDFHL